MHYDALFVINQNCDLESLCRFSCEKGYAKVCLLTTHAFFNNEKEFLDKHLQSEADILTFAECLDDTEMAFCDDNATEELLDKCEGSVGQKYALDFMSLSLAKKNRGVRDRLLSKFRFNDVYFAHGLGIDQDAWKEVSGCRLPFADVTDNVCRSPKTGLFDSIRARIGKREFYLLTDGDRSFLFLSSLKRLHVSGKHTKLIFNPVRELLAQPFQVSPGALVTGFVARHEKQLGQRFFLAATIHDYSDWMSTIDRPLYLFVDGYHPGNYSRSYQDSYQAEAFVPRTMFDVCWFERYGCRTIAPPKFLSPEFFGEVKDDTKIDCVVLLLNHAGDWSALVNRSDTDNLIRAFVEIAKALPCVEFIIRPHPTMTDPLHEGVDSIVRIRRYVDWCALKNLKISTVALEEDYRRGDLFISEYSQTLLDVYRKGLLGMIANYTFRRSFMIDYEETGFPHLGVGKASKEWIVKAISDPVQLIAAQNIATARYNEKLCRYLGIESA